MQNENIIKEIFIFLKETRNYWLIPIFVMLILIGAIIIFAQSSGTTSAFIYALF